MDEFQCEKLKRCSESLTTHESLRSLYQFVFLRVTPTCSDSTDMCYKSDNCLGAVKVTLEDLRCAQFVDLSPPLSIHSFHSREIRIKINVVFNMVRYGTFQILLKMDLTPNMHLQEANIAIGV